MALVRGLEDGETSQTEVAACGPVSGPAQKAKVLGQREGGPIDESRGLLRLVVW